ncbi:glycoside hydrolase family 2 TIM barrel-domain containing protein [Aquimarina sp. U1-2]|uniref:glycoside hydrolase family 2 TIM barrel-domain containing protein n=1 Tax=Aquimarina sp. U1-2 TaxID=2823141 RepID=UPI001AEC9C03|nr:glycoside hydrolase family 2 TIM barrel-domain containing protein [Aquimarina sp. U1-2]
MVLVFLVFELQSHEIPKKESINTNWKFIKKHVPQAVIKKFDDSKWESVTIPHTYNAKDILDDEDGYYRGVAWYRKKLFIPKSYKHKKVSLYFEGVSARCNVYVNNRYVGQHLGGYTAFVFDIEGVLDFGEDNTIVVKVDNSENLSITMPPAGGDFSIFGGIYRDVYLLVKHKVFFNHNYYASSGVFWTTPTNKKNLGGFKIKGQISNHDAYDKQIIIRHLLYDQNKKIVQKLEDIQMVKTGIIAHFELESAIDNPKLWSPDTPILYTLVSQIISKENEKILDNITQQVGFRYFEVNQKDGFRLNGNTVKLKGAATHQDYHNLGYAVPDSLRIKDVMLLKETGSNFIRISHYPHDRSVYKACDRLGLLAWSEIPGVNWIPYGNPFLNFSENMLKEMLFQNYNSPSIAIWGYHNEIWEPHLEAVAHARTMNHILKQEDPERLTAMAFQSTFFKNYKGKLGKEIFRIADINGFNIYEGWYQGDMETIGVFLDNLKHQYSPDRPIMLSEFGAGSDPRIYTDKPTIFDFSSSYQTRFYEPYLREGNQRNWMIGYSIWILADFQRDGRKDVVPNTNNKGLLTTDRRKKDAYYYIQARWSDNPVVHIAGSGFSKRIYLVPDRQRKEKVTVFSNLPKVRLFQNKKEIGTAKVVKGKATFETIFDEGLHIVRAEAFSANKVVSDTLQLHYDFPVTEKGMIRVPTNGLHFNIGQTRTYLTTKTGRVWIPVPKNDTILKLVSDDPFIKAYEKGHAFENVRLGISDNIKKTNLDPVYQTFVENIQNLTINVEKGEYQVTLLIAEPFLQNTKNLTDAERSWGIQQSNRKTPERVFSIIINDKKVVDKLNVVQKFGIQTAGFINQKVTISENRLLEIDFTAIKGNTLLNGLIIKKI